MQSLARIRSCELSPRERQGGYTTELLRCCCASRSIALPWTCGHELELDHIRFTVHTPDQNNSKGNHFCNSYGFYAYLLE